MRHYQTGILIFILWLCAAPLALAQCPPGLPCTKDIAEYEAGKQANDTKSDSGTCDGDFMNQIYARAWIEAERENSMAQTFISKPDSVLEYTCFDKFVSSAAHNIGPLFTESTKWQNQTINIATTGTVNIPLSVYMGDDRMDKSLKTLVLDSLYSYTNDNFFHSFLGGKATGLYDDISDEIGNSTYRCAAMQQVWTLAQCANMSAALHLTFDEIIAGDPRQLPTACGGTSITQNMYDTAMNKDYLYAVFDPVDPYLEKLNPPGMAPATECGEPIPTGLTAEIRSYTVDIAGETVVKKEFTLDSVCINPSCYYDYKSQTCKE